MGIRYEQAPDLQERMKQIVDLLFPHVRLDSVVCLRSYGSSSRGTIARCHALGKAMQIALGRKGFYLIEVIHERFDRMSQAEQTKVLIHELMHIPRTFGGGFKFHDVVNESNVGKMYENYINLSRDSVEKNNSKEFEEQKNKRFEQNKQQYELKGEGKKHGRFWF